MHVDQLAAGWVMFARVMMISRRPILKSFYTLVNLFASGSFCGLSYPGEPQEKIKSERAARVRLDQEADGTAEPKIRR